MTEPGAAPALPTASVGTLLEPKWRSALVRLRRESSGTPTRLLLLALVTVGFWSVVFAVLLRVVRYAKSAPDLGAFLPGKMLSVALLTFASMLLLSNLVTALSTFFLAKDLDLLASSPTDWLRLYLAKLTETIIHSSWMVVLLAVPLFAAFGVAYQGGPLYPLVALGAFLPYLILPAVMGIAITLTLVNIFPARRTRDLLGLVSLAAGGMLVLLLRLAQPERLARPEGFRNLLDFLAVLRTPASPWLPSEWAASMTMNWLNRVADPLPILLLWSTAAVFVVAGAWLHSRLYRVGFSKAQEGAERFVRGASMSRGFGVVFRRLPAAKREFILKDLRLFFRDTTQWSQLILLAVLIVVYVFNIRALPLYSGEKLSFYFVTAIIFLNQALSGFVLSAIAARFVFPAVSLEGRQLWLLRSSPLEQRTMLWSKYWVGTLPLLLVALVLTITTNSLLKASPFMMALSVGTLVLFTLAATAMALCFGALYPQFDSANAAQIPTSFGGLLFMISSVSLLGVMVILEARPVLRYIRSSGGGEQFGAQPEVLISLGAAALLCLIATFVPLRIARKKMELLEV